MKAIILAAGHGKRLLPYTHSAPKHMLPIANKPLLQYLVEHVAKAGIKELGIVVGYKKEQIIDYFGDGKKFGVKITYIPQEERLGISHAIKTARDFIGKSEFIVLLGDNLFFEDLGTLIKEHRESKAEASVGIHEVADPRRFGVAVIKNGRIEKIIEKPENPPSNIATVGVYVFSSGRIFDVIEKQKSSKRGEYEIPDSLNMLIERGNDVHGIRIGKRWKDTGKKEDMLEANAAILDEMGGGTGEGSKIDNSKIISPCIIGKNCIIKNSKIGPHVSIGNNAKIENCTVENSIIGEGCEISYQGKIIDSIIGRFSKIRKNGSQSSSFSIGDDSEVSES
jgi:glucose-1-phosphate thymidylyltransferase